MSIFSYIKNYYQKNNKANQFAKLSIVTLITIPIGIVTNILLTKYLSVEDYGNYMFILGIFNFTIVIFTLGFFQACNRALVLNNDAKKAKEYYGTGLLILISIFIVMSAFLFAYAFFDVNLKQKSIEKIFLFSIPIGSIFLLLSYFENLFQADNKIELLAQSRILPKLIFLIVLYSFPFLYDEFSLDSLGNILLIYFCTQMTACLFIIYKINISISSVKTRFKEIWAYNKSFGLNVYYGSIFAVGFSALTGVLIGYFGYNNSGVGFYAIALSFSMPLMFIPNTIATTYYKDFASSKNIGSKLIYVTIVLSLLALIAVWIIVPPFVNFFYGEAYNSVVKINFILSIGSILHGMGDFFNRFLGANGQGRALRNSAFFVGAGLLIFSLLLIPKWGEYGASYAKLIAGLTYLISILFYYVKFIKKNQLNNLPNEH